MARDNDCGAVVFRINVGGRRHPPQGDAARVDAQDSPPSGEEGTNVNFMCSFGAAQTGKCAQSKVLRGPKWPQKAVEAPREGEILRFFEIFLTHV